MLGRMLSLALAIVAAGWLVGLPGGIPAGAQAPRTVTVALYADAISLDPEDTNDNLSLSIEREIFDGLVGFTPDMKLKPELATSWEASTDARVFTFHLRRGVKFQDGTPLNAQAVKLNFDRARDAEHKLKKYSLYEEIASVDAVDEATVRFTLRKPFGAMLYNFAHPSSRIISPATIKQGEEQIARHPVGTGPFKFVSWAPGREIVLERNPEYWESGKPAVDRIVFKLITEDASRVATLLSGEAQFIYQVPAVQAEAVSKAPGVSLDKRWSIFASYIAMNNQKAPFNSPQVRQAMNYAVDKDAIIKVVLRGYGRMLDSPIAPGVIGYSAVQPGGWPYDLAKAKQLLAEGGFPQGFTTVLWLGNQTETIRLGEAIQQMLSKIGVKVNLQPMEAGTLTTMRYKPFAENQSQLNLGGWSPSTGDADWALRPHFDSSSWPPTLVNYAFYKNPKVDAALLDALSSADQSRRTRDYAQAMRIIWADAPWIFLHNQQILAAVRNSVTGVYALPDGTVDVRQATLTGK
jgi:glutathione transport system substrate-binding protein